MRVMNEQSPALQFEIILKSLMTVMKNKKMFLSQVDLKHQKLCFSL